MKTATAIICAYNEESTIKEVIEHLYYSMAFDEIIVVNDGSTDGTKMVVENLKKEIYFIDIHLAENKGKGYAMATGVEKSQSDVILFVDADLSNITSGHLRQLLEPVANNEADMVLGQPTETLIHYSVNPFKSFAGQRSLIREDILPIVDKMKDSRFGVETLINLYFTSIGKRIKYVMLQDLVHPSKFEKTSSKNAVKEFAMEGKEIGVTALKNYDLIIKSLQQVIAKN